MFCLALSYNTIPRFHKTNMYRKLHLLFSVLCVYVLTTESVFFVFCRFHLDLLESHSLDGYCLLLVLDDSEKGMRELHISNNHRHVRLLRYNIRASVDALCRDDTSEISRDPRTKLLQTRRESLARPSKHTNNNLYYLKSVRVHLAIEQSAVTPLYYGRYRKFKAQRTRSTSRFRRCSPRLRPMFANGVTCMSRIQSMDVPVTSKECKRAYARTVRRASHTMQQTDCVLAIDIQLLSEFHAPINSRLTTANSPYHARRAVFARARSRCARAALATNMLVMTRVSVNSFDSSIYFRGQGEREWTLAVLTRSYIPASSLPRENPLLRDFSIFVPYSSSSSSSSSSVNPLSPYQNKPRR